MAEFKVEGFREIERAMMELSRAAAKGVARRVLKRAGEPLRDAMSANAPEGVTHHLEESYAVSTKLNRRQRRMSAKASEVEVYVGTNDPAGVQQEFGNSRHGAQPHVRPAWAAGWRPALEAIAEDMRAEVEKSVARARKRAARRG